MPAHWINDEWRNYIACPDGYVLETDVRVVTNEIDPGRKVFHFNDSKCVDLTNTGQKIPTSGPSLWIIGYIINVPVFFFLMFLLSRYWSFLDSRVPSRAFRKVSSVIVWSGLLCVVVPPFLVLSSGPLFLAGLDEITRSTTVSYFMVSIIPFAIISGLAGVISMKKGGRR